MEMMGISWEVSMANWSLNHQTLGLRIEQRYDGDLTHENRIKGC